MGQEVVARVHFRGHVNRQLRRVRFAPGAGDAELPPPHAPLTDAEGKSVGDVRSAVHSPTDGPVGIAMVRREVPPGTPLTARWESGEWAVEVVG